MINGSISLSASDLKSISPIPSQDFGPKLLSIDRGKGDDQINHCISELNILKNFSVKGMPLAI